MTTEATMTVDVRGTDEYRKLLASLIRFRDDVDEVVRGILPSWPHTPEVERVPSAWPQMRVVKLNDDTVEMRIGGARWLIAPDRWDEAGDFLDRVRALWDMRVVWANAGTPVDGPCAKRLLDENEELRRVAEAAHECHLEATKDHNGFALIPVEKYETLCTALSAHWAASSRRAVPSNSEEQSK